MNLFNKDKKNPLVWCLVDCVRVQRYEFDEFPCWIGPEGMCKLLRDKRDTYSLVKARSDVSVLLNGVPMGDVQPVEVESEYSVKVGSSFYLLKGSSEVHSWIKGLNCERWVVVDARSGNQLGKVPFAEIPDLAGRLGLSGYESIATAEGAQQAFYLKDIIPEVGNYLQETRPSPVPETPSQSDAYADYPDEDSVSINTVSGEFTCPHCWQHFDRGDVMWVARHADLRDPDLGDEYQLRFFPTSFDELGRAIDGMGMSCSELACPNCKSKLPPQFLDLDTHIISVVGAPSAGKSYFLTSMINQLEEVLPNYFGLSFQDGHASGNALVTDMRAKLFSDSRDPAEIALDKTVPGAEMFKQIMRDGRMVRLPKPFTYVVSPFTDERRDLRSLLLVFYDNAGEQFLPAERGESTVSDDTDSTQHLASSSAIFFLYDPASNVRFRKMITGKQDPQLTDERFLKLNRQDNIIAEMRNRIKSELFIDANDRIDTPLAMIIGKCDLWANLLETPLLNPVTNAGLDLDAIDLNSANIRNFLLTTSPGVVGSAESISHQVVYFPVSPIGHSPQTFVPPGGTEERIGPVPGLVDPRFPEVPVLWNLARLRPELIKTCRGEAVRC